MAGEMGGGARGCRRNVIRKNTKHLETSTVPGTHVWVMQPLGMVRRRGKHCHKGEVAPKQQELGRDDTMQETQCQGHLSSLRRPQSPSSIHFCVLPVGLLLQFKMQRKLKSLVPKWHIGVVEPVMAPEGLSAFALLNANPQF